MVQSFFDGVENIAGKGGKEGTSIFSFSHNVFKRHFPFSQKSALKLFMHVAVTSYTLESQVKVHSTQVLADGKVSEYR